MGDRIGCQDIRQLNIIYSQNYTPGDEISLIQNHRIHPPVRVTKRPCFADTCISDRMCSKNGCWIAKTTPPPSLGKIPLFFSCLLFIEPPYVTTVLQQLEENLKNLFGTKMSKIVARFQSRSLQCSGVRWQGWLGKSPHWHLGSSLLVKKNALEGGLKFIV